MTQASEIGGALPKPPEMETDPAERTGPLSGIRVLDLGILVAGPQAAAMLGDLGAEVIKVELPGIGDRARGIPLSGEDRRSAIFFACNRGKRSMTLDLRMQAGGAVWRKLVATADVLISNFKPGTLDEWGLGYDELAAINPRLIFAAGSAYGPAGPEANSEGMDLGGQATSGLLGMSDPRGGGRKPVQTFIGDHCAGMNLVVGVLAALQARERTGRGQEVHASLLGALVFAQSAEYTHCMLGGDMPTRISHGHPLFHGIMACFPTQDGAIVVMGVTAGQRKSFYTLIERPELADDPRYAQMIMKLEDKESLFSILDEVFPSRTTAEWLELGREAGQRFAPVRNYAEVLANRQVWENDYVVEVDHPEWGRIPIVGVPIRLSDTPAKPATVAPELGQHTEEVLQELGFTSDDITKLYEQKVI